MNFRDRILACFYGVILSYLSITLPNGGLSMLEVQSSEVIASGRVESFSNPDKLYLVSSIESPFVSYFRLEHSPNVEHFFNEPAFQYFYLKSIYVSVLVFLAAVVVGFGPIDIIFPFHYFW